MICHDGLWWPDDDRNGRAVIARDVRTDVPKLLNLVRGRGCVIQAGGNVGLYPKMLAKAFAKVVTFEPDPENFACMSRNVTEKNIVMVNAALGEATGFCEMEPVGSANCGAHRVRRDGDIPIRTIDDFDLKPDLIWLDIEGFEPFALRGAEKTVEASRPVIAIEEKGLSRHYGVGFEQTEAWLHQRGYIEIDRIGRDRIYV